MKPQSSGLCLIVRDEAQDIAEWVLHHASLGFDQIIIYDNQSTDGTTEIVEHMSGFLPIERVAWPTKPGVHAQLSAYEDCLRRWRGRLDWIGFVDADEFLIPPTPKSGIRSLLAAHAEHDCFAISWVLFGSSGLEDTTGRLVTESFLRRGLLSHPKNALVKQFVRPEKVSRVRNPHCLIETPCFDLDGKIIAWPDPENPGRGIAPVVGDWRLHHYFVRSQAHWRRRLVRGQPRGLARSAAEFRDHDLNDEEDSRALPFARRVRAEMEERGLAIGKAPPPGFTMANVKCVVDSLQNGHLRGWAVDLDNHARHLTLRALVDGEDAGSIKPSLNRPDVRHQGYTTATSGFRFSVPAAFRDGQRHALRLTDESGAKVVAEKELTLYVELEFTAHPAEPGQSTAASPDDNAAGYRGYFDEITDLVARGWAVAPHGSSAPVELSAFVDGSLVGTVLNSVHRPDVRASGDHPTGNVGFAYRIPDKFLDGESHRLSFEFPDGTAVRVDGLVRTDPESSRMFAGRPPPVLLSSVDGLERGFIRGWVVQSKPETGKLMGSHLVKVSSNGMAVAVVTADKYRGDVARLHGCDPRCGFQFEIPRRFRRPHPQTFRFSLLHDDTELAGSPSSVTVVSDGVQAKLISTHERLQGLLAEVSALERTVSSLLTDGGYNVSDYDKWARHYYRTLRHRAEAAHRVHAARNEPLISVVVPTYRPNIPDFLAAVGSVVSQTYQNWELVIVDDGSGSPELTAVGARLVESDQRIRFIAAKRNGGISSATNIAIRAAEGEWLVLFDHDDLLEDVALEWMMNAAHQTGARMLYSDEDKVDETGAFSEPNFKPNYNHRLLLSQNYICHLLMVRMDVAREVGPFRKIYNGSQDHDFILRCTEMVDPSAIHHVPELLYHWRKTDNSTASDISTKQYAVEAGVRAVSAHLKRLKKHARVEAIRGVTLYRVNWTRSRSPNVSIVIPFRNQLELTSRCVNRVLEMTAYPNYEIVLVDNWSDDADIVAFTAGYHAHPKIRMIRIEEEFNFSRLNNIAARQTAAEFVFFMNNDLFIEQPGWLQTVVDEALADDRVAIVGGKFLYPNRTIQHAGIVLVGADVAQHGHLGAGENDFGYTGRAMAAQEISAVTAAGMLVRASHFAKLGGFDEVGLKVAYNDVDLCLKAWEAGYKVVWTPDFVAEHHESVSRGYESDPTKLARLEQERQTMLERWGAKLRRDPFFSPHFDQSGQPFFDLAAPDIKQKAAAELLAGTENRVPATLTQAAE